MATNLRQGLRETPEDLRDFQLGAITRLPHPTELPAEFILEPLGVKDQLDSDFCSAFAYALASEIQEGVELSPEYSFALSKELSGDPEEWGQNLRDAGMAHVKCGALEKKDAPYTVQNKPVGFLRYLSNWPGELKEKTAHRAKKALFKITGPYDAYDNIRASMWKFRNEKRAVVTGLIWGWSVRQFLLDGVPSNGFGHAVCLIGWNASGLVLQNSAGKSAGVDGKHIISRVTVNHFVAKYGAYMFVDLTPEEAKYYLDNGIKLEDNWLMGILKVLASIFKIIWK